MAARPTTSNPKRRNTVSSPTCPTSEITPRGCADAERKPLLALHEDITAEVLWSAEPSVPSNILARPHTSNPRYVEMNQRDTPRKEAPPAFQPAGVASTASAVTTSTPQLTCGTPSDKSPDQRIPGDVSGVLWACDSESIDPSLIARPVTANPWLRRLFESGVLPEANWSKKGSQILWSSIDVEDWRMLARPHASNPLLERAVEDAAGNNESSPIVAHKMSEVLWQREREAEILGIVPSGGPSDAVLAGSSSVLHVEEPQQASASAKQPPSTTAPSYSGVLEAVEQQSNKIENLEMEVRQLKSVVHELVSLIRSSAIVATKGGDAIAPAQRPLVLTHPTVEHHTVRTQRGSTDSHMNVDEEVKAATLQDKELGGHRTSQSDVLTFVADPSPLSTTIPRLREEYPAYQHAPSPPRVAPYRAPPLQPHRGEQYQQQHAAHSSMAPKADTANADAEHDGFVIEDHSVIEPQLEGADTPKRSSSRRGEATEARDDQRPESAQVQGAGSRVVHHLRQSIQGASRPQSAPLHAYNTRRGNHTMASTTTFSKEGSNALLLNNKVIAEQYQKLVRHGHPFALKSDFTEMYRQKSEEFGMRVSSREIERKLESFHSAGKDYLTYEEFSVLYLHIAQW